MQTYERGADFLKEQPDIACLIADYHMPDLDGLELVSEMRKCGSQSSMIMTTAVPLIQRSSDAQPKPDVVWRSPTRM